MKSYLAIDTASSYLTVLVRDRTGKMTTTYLADCAMSHSVKLLPVVEETLEKAGVALADIDFFACNVGAGSFTGIRIGIATIKGFCTAFAKPCMAVTSFDAIAYTTGRSKTLATVHAGHNYFYVCGYDENKEEILSARYLSKAEVDELKKEDYLVAGFEELPFENAYQADMVIGLQGAIEAKGKNKDNFVSCEALVALYVRKSQAEENRK